MKKPKITKEVESKKEVIENKNEEVAIEMDIKSKDFSSYQSPKRFKRVDEVESNKLIKKKELTDNSYTGTFGEQGWGFKANETLKHTRGKGFRHEKTKKKRGSYRGGLIDDSAVNSVKFD